MSFGSLHLSRNWSISFILSKLWVKSYFFGSLSYPFNIHKISNNNSSFISYIVNLCPLSSSLPFSLPPFFLLSLWDQFYWSQRTSFLKKFLFYFLYSRFLLVIYFIHISVYMSIPISQFIPPPPHPHPIFPTWCPYICPLRLCLYFCLANGFICTIFLDSTYMR